MEKLNTKTGNISTSYNFKSSSNAALTVVFIHGFPFDKTMWNEQLEQLPESVRGVAYDIRGFGESSTDHLFFSIDLFARDVLQLIKTLQLESCVLCGISMGGYVALRALEISQENIKGLILCDTNCNADTNEAKLKRFASIELITTGGKNAFVEGFVKNVFNSETLDKQPQTVDFLRNLMLRARDESICAAQLALASRTDTSGTLKNIQLPALIIKGENDKLMSEEQTTQLANGISGSEYIIIKNSGHLPNLENAADFNKALNNYLSKHFLS
ncbi:MAG: alpha/beta fold hydrolase [Sphingobacteriaceae bacterium]|nr:alpha/beta fold hydrolase [Sphingobacteriaceae bacterium]